ncbi:MAG: fumarate hydratase [Nitrospirae bacterium]|nr:fumarate hydratase [Nitrospirota bacterium]MCL5976888.1 fumarate hydratase [Nitrospirota bacterium]
MLKLRDGIIELYKKVATSVPNDVEEALKNAYSRETSPLAKGSMEIILSNISLARTTSRPICQDTGFPVFFIKVPKGISHQLVKETVIEATRIATKKVPLRPNAVDIVTGKNTGDNTGDHFPLIYMDETEDQSLSVDLMLKGGGCENLGQTYKLPAELRVEGYSVMESNLPNAERNNTITVLAERDFDGVRKCVLDAVFKAQGKGCPPYTIGVAIGGAKDQVAFLSKRQLMRRITDNNPDNQIAELEQKILSDINTLGIGAAGMGGETTAIGVKIGTGHRHPASYFVDVSFSCWANRRGRLIW